MQSVDRRTFLLASTAAAACLLGARPARATLVRGLTLPALVARSRHVVLLQSLESYCHYVEIGGRRSIVTDTRVRIEDTVVDTAPEAHELTLRTLGGRVGRFGEIVHGQAELEVGVLGLAFLTPGSDATHWFVGMAQGHYSLEGSRSERARLLASRNLPTIRDWQGSAVKQLAGQTLQAARILVRQAPRP